jgi:hypothetical protein
MLGTAPHRAVFFVWLIVDQPFFLISMLADAIEEILKGE